MTDPRVPGNLLAGPAAAVCRLDEARAFSSRQLAVLDAPGGVLELPCEHLVAHLTSHAIMSSIRHLRFALLSVSIEWRPNAPKWVQVADVIKQRIADGVYPPDTQLPSQHELVREFGIAPNTAAKVLARLREQGVAYTVRGLGTFVAPPSGDTSAS